MDSSRGVRDRCWTRARTEDNERQRGIQIHETNAAREHETFVEEPGSWSTELLLSTTFVRTLRNRLSEVVRDHDTYMRQPALTGRDCSISHALLLCCVLRLSSRLSSVSSTLAWAPPSTA